MRPREREHDPSAPESSPTPSAPPPRTAGNLSSMVVRPSESVGGEFEPGEVNHRLQSPTPATHRRGSPPLPLRRRGESPEGFGRRDSPPVFRRRGGGSPPAFHHPRPLQRFHENPGHLQRAGPISPPSRRPRLDDGHCDPDFVHPAGPRIGRGFRGGRGGGRFRDVSPHNGFGRGGRSFGRGYDVDRRGLSGRGYDVDRRGLSPSEEEYVHRNDPNLSPREGDWICGNPRCGNLNFARRTYCNNCDQPRSAPGRPGPSRSPRRGYFPSPPPRGSPPSIEGPPIDRGTRRNFNGYRSPPRGWGPEDLRDFGTGSPPPRRGGRFQDHMRRDNRLDYEDDYRGRGKFDWPVEEDWDRRDDYIPERRGYDRRPPSPRERWVRESRERSRSPIGGRPLKNSYMGRGREDRHYDNSYMGRGRSDDFDLDRGRVFRQSNDSFNGRGRGNRRGMGSGRNTSDMY